MCGEQFDSLFPGLEAFGRDKQIAWMMWHAAPDRRLPDIDRVLDGVPDDLQRVAPAAGGQRSGPPLPIGAGRAPRPSHGTMTAIPEEKPPEPAQDPAARHRRTLPIGAGLPGLPYVPHGMIFVPLGGRSGPLPRRAARAAARNHPQRLRRRVGAGPGIRLDVRPREIAVKPRDRIFINGKAKLLRHLQPEDRASIKIRRDEYGLLIQEIQATRPELHRGVIVAVKPDEGQFTLKVTEGEEQGKKIVISLPTNVKTVLHGRRESITIRCSCPT